MMAWIKLTRDKESSSQVMARIKQITEAWTRKVTDVAKLVDDTLKEESMAFADELKVEQERRAVSNKF